MGEEIQVDYIIIFKGESSKECEKELTYLIRKLYDVGLKVQCRSGDNGSILVFVHCPEKKLLGEVKRQRYSFVYMHSYVANRQRIRDWVQGVRIAAPEQETEDELSVKTLTEADRLRHVYHLVTAPLDEGGAGITPKLGRYPHVDSIFTLHNPKFGKKWVTSWAKTWSLSDEDLDDLRDHMGEKIAFYFSFLQFYFQWLLIPAIFGISVYVTLGGFSILYTVVVCLWGIMFTQVWKRRERDLSVRWGSKGCSIVETRRAAFQGESIETDPITNRQAPSWPVWKRIARRALAVPFVLLAGAVLAVILTCIFSVEIVLSEIYNGPFKSYLVFTPTLLFLTVVPIFSGYYTAMSTNLTHYENHKTSSGFNSAWTQKIFILNFLTSYMSLFLTAFIYGSEVYFFYCWY